MRKSPFTEEQILQAIRQADSGTAVMDVCRKLGISEQTSYRWRPQYSGLEASEVRELKSLKEEDRKRKQIVADLTLDKTILRDALGKNGAPDHWRGIRTAGPRLRRHRGQLV